MYFRIGEFSKICNVSVKTIRYYESYGLLNPVYVDNITGYRYFDKTSCTRLLEIKMLKELGFSLKEIKGLNIEIIKEKINKLKEELNLIERNISKLELITKENESTSIKEFINDEKVIGKWKIIDQNDFIFDEIYFLPNGKGYWVFDGWTKGFLKIMNVNHKYKIKGEELWLYLNDLNRNVGKIVKYKNIDHLNYKMSEIKQIDDVSYTFEVDLDVIGTYKAIAYVDDLDINLIMNEQSDLYINKMVFIKDGTIIYETEDGKVVDDLKWTKGKVIDDVVDFISCVYKIIHKDNLTYLFLEWKNGDYLYGKRKPKYYVFLKEQN